MHALISRSSTVYALIDSGVKTTFKYRLKIKNALPFFLQTRLGSSLQTSSPTSTSGHGHIITNLQLGYDEVRPSLQ